MGKKKQQYHTVAMHTGYAESNSAACLLMTSSKKFASQSEAVVSLADELWIKYQVDNRDASHKMHCVYAKKDGKDTCSVCEKDLKDLEFNEDVFQSFIIDLFNKDFDGWGSDSIFRGDYDSHDGAQWCFNNALECALKDPKGVIIMNEYAERILCEALDPSITNYSNEQRASFLSGKFDTFYFNNV